MLFCKTSTTDIIFHWKALLIQVYSAFTFSFYLYYTIMCIRTVYSVLSPSPVKTRKAQAHYSGGIRTHDLWNSRAVSNTHWGLWVKTKINILYPRCKFNIIQVCCVIWAQLHRAAEHKNWLSKKFLPWINRTTNKISTWFSG